MYSNEIIRSFRRFVCSTLSCLIKPKLARNEQAVFALRMKINTSIICWQLFLNRFCTFEEFHHMECWRGPFKEEWEGGGVTNCTVVPGPESFRGLMKQKMACFICIFH